MSLETIRIFTCDVCGEKSKEMEETEFPRWFSLDVDILFRMWDQDGRKTPAVIPIISKSGVTGIRSGMWKKEVCSLACAYAVLRDQIEVSFVNSTQSFVNGLKEPLEINLQEFEASRNNVSEGS